MSDESGVAKIFVYAPASIGIGGCWPMINSVFLSGILLNRTKRRKVTKK